MKLTFTKMLALGAASLLTVSIAHADISNPGVDVTINEQDENGDPNPSFWTSNFNTTNDLLNGLAASSSTGDFTAESTSGASVLTDGLLPPISGGHSEMASVGGSDGTELIYTFASAVNLTDVQLFGGWSDNGRSSIDTNAYYSTDGGLTYNLIANEDKVNGGPGVIAFFVDFTPTTNTYLGSNANITNLKFDFDNSAPNGGQGMAEIVAHGVAATPEPSTIALGLSGALVLGLCMFRRRLA